MINPLQAKVLTRYPQPANRNRNQSAKLGDLTPDTLSLRFGTQEIESGKPGDNAEINTEFLQAAEIGDTKTLRRLLNEANVDINAQDSEGYTALHWAIGKMHTDVAKILLGAGANLNLQDQDGWTPLHLAADWGQVKEVKLLLDAGADPNITTNRNETPLHYAGWCGSVDAINLLLKAGAKDNIKDNFGYTPLALAIKCKRSDVAEVLYAAAPLHKRLFRKLASFFKLSA